MEPEASEALLQELFAHLYGDPANFYQHDWHARDLLIWDNLSTQHGRPNLTREAPERTLRKVISPLPTITMAKPTFEPAPAST
jgi:taurine dioxygenase